MRLVRADGRSWRAAVSPADRGPTGSLTPQELQIVRSAARGLSNKDIAAQFSSARAPWGTTCTRRIRSSARSRDELSSLDLN